MILSRIVARAIVDLLTSDNLDTLIQGSSQVEVANFIKTLAEAIDTAQGDAGDDSTQIEDADIDIQVQGGDLD